MGAGGPPLGPALDVVTVPVLTQNKNEFSVTLRRMILGKYAAERTFQSLPLQVYLPSEPPECLPYL